MHQTTIVIADDHDLLRQGLRSILAREDWRIVAEAVDGQAALNAVTEYRPDVAIIDFFLPFMNGLELTRRIRHDSPNTEVLIFTMLNDESIVRDVLVAGAKGFLFKTDPGEQIVAAVHALSHHKPFFSESIPETLLARHLKRRGHAGALLTDRELTVVQHICDGLISEQVATAMGISAKTVGAHRASVMQKLKLKSVAELVRYAVRNHIIEA